MRGNKARDRSGKQLAMLGHELRNVLHGILGVTELLSHSSLGGEQQQLVKTLQQSGRQLHWLIDSLACARQKVEFPITPRPDVLNGVDLLEQAVRCHTTAAAFNNNLLILTIEPGLPAWWRSDEHLLRLVIDNLLANAIKFTRSGLVEIELRQSSRDQCPDSGLDLVVRDSGPGISRADSNDIFEPWVQLENGWDNDGSGLGLYVCRRIVSSLDGKLDYRFESGAGSCFQVYLPGVLEPQMNNDPAQACGLLSTVCCLVSVEDDLCRSIETLLERLGIHWITCGEEESLESDSDLRIRITEPGISPNGQAMRAHLLLTHQSSGDPGARTLRSRWLQTPFLESTLGPLLMEIALEWRLCLLASESIAPNSDEKPD